VPLPLEIHPRTRWTELILNQPPRNVLDREMLTALVTALDEQAAGGAPPLLIRSTGKHFSTGYSIRDIPEEIFHRDPAVRAGAPFEQLMGRLINYPAPIVAALQGDAYGGAVEALACCDLRVAARGVRVGVPSVRLGLVYSHSGLRRMVRTFGSPLVREMLFTGEAISAERAFQVGFFNRLVAEGELEETAEQVMTTLTRGGPDALRGTRCVLNLLEETEALSDEALTEIAEIRHRSWSGNEFVKARDAFINKEPSPFGGEDES
jgi:enoyl-CoA hydratase/carnithine racemase